MTWQEILVAIVITLLFGGITCVAIFALIYTHAWVNSDIIERNLKVKKVRKRKVESIVDKIENHPKVIYLYSNGRE